ncbi:MAG: ABC transporter permease [Bryobacteraceae bacterium]|jgi:predicted permease
MSWLLEDLRYALRALAKNRGFAWAAVASLALGIGANATIFTLIDAVFLRPLDVRDPARLAAVQVVDARNPGNLMCSYPNFKDYRDRNQVFSSLLLYTAITVGKTGRGDAQMEMGQLVSGNYFSTLGVRMATGRGFLPEEDAVLNARPVAVISYGLWTRQFARDPRVTSRTLEINGQPYNIVGVAEAGFQGLARLYAADIWVPMTMYERVYSNPAWVNQRRKPILVVAGRLKPGVTMGEAEASLGNIARELEREYPRDNEGQRVKLTSLAEAAIDPGSRGALSSGGAALMLAATLVLLIACANVANLLLARASERHKEIAVRLAMGASRWRLVRQLLLESALLALLGGAAGLAGAEWARDILWALRPPLLSLAGVRPELDGRVLAYAAAVSLLTGLLFGLAPALRATRVDLASDLKERTGRPASRMARQALVVGQLALSVIALTGAGLFVRSMQNALSIDPGFAAGRLGIVAFDLPESSYNESRGREFQRRVLEQASAVPGVVSAALAKDPPLHVSMARTLLLEGQESDAGRFTRSSIVSPGYFKTLGIPLLSGRDFSPLDGPDAPRVAVLNQAAADLFWPGRDPLGRQLRFAGDNRPAEVIGVARNANYLTIGEPPQALLYLSLDQYYFPTAVLHIRTRGDPEAAVAAARAEVQSLDRNLPLQAESVDRTIRQSLWAPLLAAWLAGAFGALALALAAVGTYGVVSYAVNQRTRELGVRMALGATPGEVQRAILKEGFKLVAWGLAAGMVAALALSRFVQSLLFATSAHDPVTFALVPAFLALVALAACWVPAMRAARLSPSAALREE